ncbi:VOC family protein [Desertihabitans aurantiacus]|uniref:VOC family protein n=1 Tax=Desertihabitans aurantiacus TaxID=2282477 RepID=UPI000DF80F69|nr:VOC family protein [Desertihabitans aurantiacus]
MQRTYPHGVTSWIDTEQPDPDAAAEFYAALLGWATTEAMPPGVPGTYRIATLDGQDVAGLTSAEGPTARWRTYVAVDDLDRTAEVFRAAGGTLEVFEAQPPGRAAVGTDPTGAEIRLWQAGHRLGAQLANVPGAWNFSDLHTPDPAAATDFYRRVFGWEVDAGGDGPSTVRVPGYGRHLADTVDPGIVERQAAAPEGFADVIGAVVPDEAAWWEVTFTVADRDEAAERAVRLGAAVLSTTDTGWTRQAVVRDPQGARFVLSQFTPPEGW